MEVTARLLPNTLTAHGLVTVPPVTISPQIDVTVNAPSGSSSDTYTDAMRKAASMAGSGSVIGGNG
ncbi:MAG: hypothetical protein IPK52_21910 [Chloroflexi bacterium]|nr:hypothetical protein [Chloroflexota bacterium]